MIYPEPGMADQYRIPWWIILIAVLAGILLLTLLVCLLWKVTHTLLSHVSSTIKNDAAAPPSVTSLPLDIWSCLTLLVQFFSFLFLLFNGPIFTCP